ncbi:hypothetical protein BVRB_1g013860 [Beta vulgaris subsp. vulgaris]|nr:hypothetical protein BVRB_1g013860 [Beta vulgaris subsp. vulgaris]
MCEEKAKKVEFDSEIAENEIILKKLEGTSESDEKLKEWEEKKKKLVTKEDDLFFKKCNDALSPWVKAFPRNDIRQAELCRAFDAFMQGGNMRCRDFDHLQHWEKVTLFFPWRNKENNHDCGVYAIKCMELYDGENANEFPLVDLKRAATKKFQRCKLALRLVDHPLNKLKDKVKRDCYVWSAKKRVFLID